MKKIGVITFHKAHNYGAFLQCFALQRVISRLDGEASVIDYVTEADIERYKIFSFKHPKKTIKNIMTISSSIKRCANFKKAQECLTLTDKSIRYDIAITGSDQVWNPNLSGSHIDPYYTLKQINARKKISYAASIGNEKVIEKNPKEYSELIDSLSDVSVREAQASEALRKISNKKIKVVLDPTALLRAEEWLGVINNIDTDRNNYIFSYFIEIRDDQAEALAKICEKLKLKTISYTQIPKEKNIYKKCYSDGPFEFLARLRDSKLVITSSFHGTILSIILHKNFYVLMPAKEKRSRMDNILKLVGLTDRIIETEADINKINLDSIDYTEPQKKLDILRKDSLDWLKNAIEK